MKKNLLLPVLLIAILPVINAQPLKVSNNGRHLLTIENEPFFWLGDTGWELFHRLDREEATKYFKNRAELGYNLIQAVVLHELQAFESANAFGDFPLIDKNIAKPDTTFGKNPEDDRMYDYWDHVDFIVEEGIRHGLIMGILPCWGEYVTPRFRERTISTIQQGYEYGFYIGSRLKRFNDHIVWILGGDRLPDEAINGVEIWRAMAEGITDGVNGVKSRDNQADYTKTFMTYHCYTSSAKWFHHDDWIDMHTWGSYHEKRDNERAYYTAYQDWVLPHPKPTLNSEPAYELLPINYDWVNVSYGRFDDFDVRQAAYWSVLSGTCGHTYGCNYVWQMFKKENPVPGLTDSNQKEWDESLNEPGAIQMLYLKKLMYSRFSIYRKPDLKILSRNPHDPTGRLVAGSSPHCILVYNPTGKSVGINPLEMEKLFHVARAWWYNPRTGEASFIGEVNSSMKKLEFKPEGEITRGNDWVLVLDDADKNFGKPGK
jgi:hypothetical protein